MTSTVNRLKIFPFYRGKCREHKRIYRMTNWISNYDAANKEVNELLWKINQKKILNILRELLETNWKTFYFQSIKPGVEVTVHRQRLWGWRKCREGPWEEAWASCQMVQRQESSVWEKGSVLLPWEFHTSIMDYSKDTRELRWDYY